MTESEEFRSRNTTPAWSTSSQINPSSVLLRTFVCVCVVSVPSCQLQFLTDTAAIVLLHLRGQCVSFSILFLFSCHSPNVSACFFQTLPFYFSSDHFPSNQTQHLKRQILSCKNIDSDVCFKNQSRGKKPGYLLIFFSLYCSYNNLNFPQGNARNY